MSGPLVTYFVHLRIACQCRRDQIDDERRVVVQFMVLQRGILYFGALRQQHKRVKKRVRVIFLLIHICIPFSIVAAPRSSSWPSSPLPIIASTSSLPPRHSTSSFFNFRDPQAGERASSPRHHRDRHRRHRLPSSSRIDHSSHSSPHRHTRRHTRRRPVLLHLAIAYDVESPLPPPPPPPPPPRERGVRCRRMTTMGAAPFHPR